MLSSNHFFWRAGFGPTPSMLFQEGNFKPKIFWEAMLIASKKYNPIEVTSNPVDGLMNGLSAIANGRKVSEEEKQRIFKNTQQQKREEIKNINLKWLDEMTYSNGQLREKIALFWHGHFACRNLNSFYQQQLLEVIRANALGNFGDLLTAVSKTPAMLQFLNNQQNRKLSPNENFAREVMELFTLGRGNYTENDIKEAAKAFTGWGYNGKGEFIFRSNQHDSGSKTIFGKTGNFDGDDVIKLLLAQKQTATYIITKLYRFLVSETNIDQQKIQDLSAIFYKNNYEIQPVLEAIFTSNWFYNTTVATPKIKSPIEYWVGLRRLLQLELQAPEIQLQIQRSLGQILLYPPNVAGWPGGKNWIDSSSLLFRMRLAQQAASSLPINVYNKRDDDVDMGNNQVKGRNQLNAKADWDALAKVLENNKKLNYNGLASALLQSETYPSSTIVLQTGANKSAELRQAVGALLATPQYQLC